MIYINLIRKYDYFDQRDILSLLTNLFSLDPRFDSENKKLFIRILSYSRIELNDTNLILQQDVKIRNNYELIVLDTMSISSRKYANFILEYIFQTTKSSIYKNKITSLIESFNYSDEIKEDIAREVNLYLKSSLHKEDQNFINELTNNSLIPIKQKYSTIEKMKQKVVSILAFSSNDGDYGIKVLSEGYSNIIHIFINGFTNDSPQNNFNKWLENTKGILDKNDTFLGFDWPSGKDPSTEIFNIGNLKNPTKFASVLKGVNIPYILSSLSIQTVSEWKNAHYNSKSWSKNLADELDAINADGIKINLYGHSLGANVIHHVFSHISNDVQINNIFLFGGAAKGDEVRWSNILTKVSNIYNFYSQNDLVLKILYQGIEFGDNPIGLNKIEVMQKNNLKYGKLYNYDVSYNINGHSSYVSSFNSIYYRIRRSSK